MGHLFGLSPREWTPQAALEADSFEFFAPEDTAPPARTPAIAVVPTPTPRTVPKPPRPPKPHAETVEVLPQPDTKSRLSALMARIRMRNTDPVKAYSDHTAKAAQRVGAAPPPLLLAASARLPRSTRCTALVVIPQVDMSGRFAAQRRARFGLAG
ncbi:MAG: hypothetical protein AAF748_14195 [Pseudomonadota bacterium]